MFLCPKQKKGSSVAAIFLPGLVCTMLLASWPHISIFRGSLELSKSYFLDDGQSGRVLLELQDSNNNPPINVHVSEVDGVKFLLPIAKKCLFFFPEC